MRVFGFFFFFMAIQGCLTEAELAEGEQNSASFAPDGDSALGIVSYEQKCAMCHDPLESSKKAGASYLSILNGGTVPAHAAVSPWPDEDESANLAAALAPKGDPEAGLVVYNASCANCHQPIETSNKAGSSQQSLINASTHPAHGGVNPWPDADACLDLAAALEQ